MSVDVCIIHQLYCSDMFQLGCLEVAWTYMYIPLPFLGYPRITPDTWDYALMSLVRVTNYALWIQECSGDEVF